MRTRLSALFALLASLVLSACQIEQTDPRQGAAQAPAGGAVSPLIQEGQCEAAGGKMVVGLAGPQCARPQPDAGKACTQSADCEGFCLASSGTCSPVTPFFGCHEVLVRPGTIAALCVD